MFGKLKQISKSSLFKNSFIYIATDSINKAIPFLLLPVITAYLLPAEFGIVNNFLIFSSILMIIIGLNMDGAVSANFYKLSENELKKYITSVVFLISIAFIISLGLIFVFHQLIYDYTKITLLYQALTAVLAYFYIITTIHLAVWRLREQAIKFGIYQILQTAMNLGLSLYFIIVLARGWEGRALGNLIACIVFGLVSILILYKRQLIGSKISKAYVLDALYFGLPLVPHALSTWIRYGIDRVFITKYIGEEVNGIYATGFQFGVLMTFLTVAFNNAFVPFLFKKLSNPNSQELELSKKNLVKMSYGIAVALVILCIFLSVVSYYIIEYFMPESYKGAQMFVFWALLTQTFQGLYFLVGNYIFFVKKTKIFALITFSCSMIQVILTYFLIQSHGALGAAYAAVIVGVLNFVAVWIYSQRVYPMPWFNILSR